jgi:hypothetical protein
MRQVGNDQQEASKRKTSNRTTKERSPGGFGHPRDDIHIGPRETSYIGLNLQFPVHRLLQEMELAPISCCAGRSARRMPIRSRICHGIGTMGLQAKQKGPTGPRPAAAGAYSAILACMMTPFLMPALSMRRMEVRSAAARMPS